MRPRIIRPTTDWLPALLRLVDAAAIAGAAFVAHWVVSRPPDNGLWLPIAATTLAFFVCCEISGGYGRIGRRSNERELLVTLMVWALSAMIGLGVCFAADRLETLPRSVIAWWLLFAAQWLMLGRMAVRAAAEIAFARDIGVHRTAIAGTGPLGIQVASQATRSHDTSFKLCGFYDDRDETRRSEVPADLPAYQGKLCDLVAEARAGRIDTVLITLPMRAEARIQRLLTELSDTTASVYIVPDIFVFELLHARCSEYGGMPVISIFETPIYGVGGWLKRVVDVLLSMVAIVLLSPVLLACAAAVRCSGPGPIIFKQRRYGLDGREILVWKFRSMRTCDNGPVVRQATANDPRVTPVGAVLRRTSLDELPQLFNVLTGTMSLVGPRPHASAHNELYRKQIHGYMMRHKVRPGITGLAQAYGSRGETDTLEKMQARIDLDHRYIRDWSLWLDLRIMLRTVFVVARGDAY